MNTSASYIDVTEHLDSIRQYLFCLFCRKISYKPTRVIICSHIFCEECIRNKSVCPECSTNFETKDLILDNHRQHVTKCFFRILELIRNSQDPKTNVVKLESYRDEIGEGCSIRLGQIDVLYPKEHLFSTLPNTQLRKKNKVGETKLHRACISGKSDVVLEVINQLSCNIKDNHGWTPLHEAAKSGHTAVCKLLLEAGAFIDVPNRNYITPLYLAVEYERIETIKLLLEYGATIDTQSYEGVSIKNIATKQVAMVLQTTKRSKMLRPVVEKPHRCEVVFADESVFKSVKNSNKFGIDVSECLTNRTTHYVMSAKSSPSSFDFLKAILMGVWIVKFEWYEECMRRKQIVKPEEYELSSAVLHPELNGPKRGRIRRQIMAPGLFDGCHIYVHGSKYERENMVITRENMIELITLGHGTMLKRCPAPEFIPAEKMCYPYHANGRLRQCCYYTIYLGEPIQPEYRFSEIHVLPVSWIVESIQKFDISF